MKNKKIPLRKCIGCEEMKDKKQLLRIIHTKEGEIFIDLTGKANGRGAYICPSAACLQKAEKSRALERSFRTKVNKEVYTMLNNQIEGTSDGKH